MSETTALPSFRWLAQVAPTVLVRPRLWFTALVQVLRLAPFRWWSRRPPSPAPGADYLRFRATTAYGKPDRLPDPEDVVTWLEWCRSWRLTHNMRQ